MASREPHSVSLKVMRLRKPNLVPQLKTTIPSSPFSTPALSFLADSTIIDPVLEGSGLTGLAALPNGFGSMFVGTNFLAYVCLNNESDNQVTEIDVRAELRSSYSKDTLNSSLTRVGANEPTTEEGKFSLQPGEALHMILDHKVINPGDHTLEVGITYLPPEAPHPRTFRKMYNFTTFDTILVRSMSLPSINRSVIFQMHIENTGDAPIHLTRVRFHAEPAWDVRSCNEVVEEEELSVFAGRGIGSREIFQSMHVLVPRKGGVQGAVEGEMPFALGRVEVCWVGSMGEKGSLITGLMKRRPV